ncbi:hypothetical protein Tco_1194389 [Tanacetum coccineum]
MKNDTVCIEKASNVFLKEREQYFEIQDLKAQLQDKDIAIYSLERKHFSKAKSIPKTNVSEGLSKPVTTHNLPQTARKVVSNTNVIKPGMYRIDTRTTQTRAPQLPQTYRNTNPRVSTSTGVAHRTNVSRPQPRSTQMKNKVVPNTSQVKFKKTEVEDYHRISSISNQTKSVTACNDSLKSRTSNVNAVCATCGKCVFNSNHDACVSKYLNDVNARTKKPKVVPISTRKPKSQANKSVATYRKKIVASESTITNSKSYYRMLYEKTSKAWKWWIEQQCPSGYKWVPKTKMKWVPKVRNESVQKKVSFAIDNASRITNVLKLTNTLGSNLSCILSSSNSLADYTTHSIHYLDQGNIMINRVYNVEGLNHNLFSVGQFCDADLEKDVVIGLPKLKYVKDQLCSSCEVSKAKRSSFKTKTIPSSKGRLNLLHMDLCGPMQVASINGKKYILTLNAFFKAIEASTSTLEKHRTETALVESRMYSVQAARTMLSASKLPLITPISQRDIALHQGDRLIVEAIHLRFNEIKEMSETSVANDTSGLVPQRQKELDLLFGPLYDEFFNDGTSRVNKSSSHTDNSIQKDTLPSKHIQPTSEPTTPTNVHAEENNDNQAEFTNPFCTPVQENAESP